MCGAIGNVGRERIAAGIRGIVVQLFCLECLRKMSRVALRSQRHRSRRRRRGERDGQGPSTCRRAAHFRLRRSRRGGS
eukprot:3306456-Pleurochrysis_carterae.AAC.5